MIPGAWGRRPCDDASTMRPRTHLLRRAAVVPPALVWIASAAPAFAHGPVPADAPSAATLLLGWTFEPVPTLAIVAAALWWRWAARRVDANHPANPVPRRRTVAFALGLTAIAVALLSGIDRYDTTLFSVHMVQHILLALVAAPLLALSAPITLILRSSSAATRRRWILPVLHSRAVRIIGFPVVGWLAFAIVMWLAHFSPLFDAALEDPLIHEFEHALFLGSALLFWWPALGVDPAPWRMRHPVRIAYLFLQMTQNTFLAVVLLNAGAVIYPHYASLVRAWGPSALEDQQLAAGLMWLLGDLIFIGAIMGTVVLWLRFEVRDAVRTDRRAAVDLAEIRVRERRLAERLADERGDRHP